MIIYQAHTNGIAAHTTLLALTQYCAGGAFYWRMVDLWALSLSLALCFPLRASTWCVQLHITFWTQFAMDPRPPRRRVPVRSRAHSPASVSHIIGSIVSISYSYIYYKQTAQCTFSNHQHPYIINTKSALNWIALLRNQHNHINNFAALVVLCGGVCRVLHTHTHTLANTHSQTEFIHFNMTARAAICNNLTGRE